MINWRCAIAERKERYIYGSQKQRLSDFWCVTGNVDEQDKVI